MWSVANTRWPVSAAVSAVEIVSRSRISPTRITSGSWRSAARSASAKLVASDPISRWLTMHCLVLVEELDRILDRQDVLVAGGLIYVDQRRERRRLARAGRAGDEHEAARLVGEVGSTTVGRPSFSSGAHLERDHAERRAERRALEEGVDAEAAATRDLVGEVDLPVVLELLALRLGEDRVDDLARVGRRQDREAVHRDEPAADAHHRRRTGGDVEVRSSSVNDLEQHVSEVKLHPDQSLSWIAYETLWIYRQPGRSRLRLFVQVDDAGRLRA